MKIVSVKSVEIRNSVGLLRIVFLQPNKQVSGNQTDKRK